VLAGRASVGDADAAVPVGAGEAGGTGVRDARAGCGVPDLTCGTVVGNTLRAVPMLIDRALIGDTEILRLT
jgi:hypothetical protein